MIHLVFTTGLSRHTSNFVDTLVSMDSVTSRGDTAIVHYGMSQVAVAQRPQFRILIVVQLSNV